MTIARDFLSKLQEATNQKFWETPPEKPTFQDILNHYADYYQTLKNSDERVKLSTFFWKLIKEIGTPIIEERQDGQCDVYFLFRKDNLENSNDLYLQGEFHGFGGVSGRNKLDELPDTGIMYRIDPIPINAMITYQYQQGTTTLDDDNSSHRNVYHGYPGSFIFQVNPEQSHLGKREEKNYWDRIISSERNSRRNFNYHTTLYSDANNNLHPCDTPLPQKVDIYNPVPINLAEIKDEDFSASPYADFTRAVHIFKPTTNVIDNVIIFNDGRPYILAGMMDQAEEMVNKSKLSANTAIVFIDALRGLLKTMPGIEKEDERFYMLGMGVRIIDFDKGIGNYIKFLENLFPQLSNQEINIPNDPRSRVMVGASLSGTATIYIALQKPALFNGFIAQSPSPSNDGILVGAQPKQQANIQLSCGVFEQPRYHGADTDCFKYGNELAGRLSLQCRKGLHGHNSAAWVRDLERSLPNVMRDANELSGNAKLYKNLSANKSTAIIPGEEASKSDDKTPAKSEQPEKSVNSVNQRSDTSSKPPGYSAK